MVALRSLQHSSQQEAGLLVKASPSSCVTAMEAPLQCIRLATHRGSGAFVILKSSTNSWAARFLPAICMRRSSVRAVKCCTTLRGLCLRCSRIAQHSNVKITIGSAATPATPHQHMSSKAPALSMREAGECETRRPATAGSERLRDTLASCSCS